MNMDEFWEWFGFLSKLILECICLAAWIIMAWGLQGYLVRMFPLEGIPKLMLYALEVAFY
jgi:hypothetical protein